MKLEISWLGEFDTETGYMSEAMPEHIARLIDLKETNNAKSWKTGKVLRTADRENDKQSRQQDRANVESSQAAEGIAGRYPTVSDTKQRKEVN